MAQTYLITGASRGLGAQFVRQLRDRGHDVIAAVRDPSGACDAERAGARVVELDVGQPETFEAFAVSLRVPIDVLINNAAVAAADASLRAVSTQAFEDVFRTNVFGVALLTRALLSRLRSGHRRIIVNVSSSLGSLALARRFSYAYSASKAALNMLTVLMNQELGREGFVVVSLDPGWNRTDMGGAEAPLDPTETVASMVALIERLGPDDSGRFIGHDHRPRAW